MCLRIYDGVQWLGLAAFFGAHTVGEEFVNHVSKVKKRRKK